MTVIRWETPPEARRNRWRNVVAVLAQRPGEWALVAEGVTPEYAYQSARKSLVRRGCEVKCRAAGDEGMFSIWARIPVVESSTDSGV